MPALMLAPQLRDLPLLVLGEGSNVLLVGERFEGTVVHLACAGARILEESAGSRGSAGRGRRGSGIHLSTGRWFAGCMDSKTWH